MRSTCLLRFLPLLASLAGCDSAGSDSESEPDPEALTLTPANANVATCRTLDLAVAPADASLTLRGSGALEGATYVAPTSSPGEDVVVEATSGDATATSTLRVGTAFPEEVVLVGGGSLPTPDYVDPIAIAGDRVYGLETTDGTAVSLLRSDDGGKTFGAPVGVASGGPLIPTYASIAVDAGDPDVVYVVARRAVNDVDGILELHTSEDGGATFTSRALLSGNTSDGQVPTVASPAPGVVVVAAPTAYLDADTSASGDELLVWVDTARGSGFGDLAPFDNGFDLEASPPTHVIALAPGTVLERNVTRGGTSLVTNGAGKLCLAMGEVTISDPTKTLTLRCTTDPASSLGEPTTITSGPEDSLYRLRATLDASGERVVVGYDEHPGGFTADPDGKTRIAASTDGGATFGAAVTLGDHVDEDDNRVSVADVEVLFDTEGVLWVARTVAGAYVVVDKSCDGGATFSGELALPIADAHVHGLLAASSAGVFAGAIRESPGIGMALVRLLPASKAD